MRTSQFQIFSSRVLALVAALGMGGVLCAPAQAAPGPSGAAHKESPVKAQEDVTLFAAVPGAVYLNGGIGQDEQMSMRRDASHWPLRMTFSDKANDEFVADVGLKVFDAHGQAVLRLKDAGPMTYVQLPQGEYHITASYRGDTLTRNVHVGPGGLDANFHWAG
ncbi:MAG: hypothetical protein WA917_10000 [Comamonas sp.]|nr:hypothetical protein [Comamonas sp.]